MKEKKKINATDILEVNKIFIEKGWEIGGIFFQKYLEWLSNFEEDEKSLVLELTQNYLIVSLKDYVKGIEEAIEKLFILEKKIMETKNKIYIIPLLNIRKHFFNDAKETETSITKSSNLVAYLFKSNELMHNKFLQNKKLQIIENYSKIPITKCNDNKSIVIFVDDFIGSGQTALEALRYFEGEVWEKSNKKYKMKMDNTRILSIVAHEEGEKKLESENYKMYCSKIIYKGISSVYSKDKREEKLDLMKKIEKKEYFSIPEMESLGFGKLEALITMIRTPNNTFPIFQKSKKGKVPFARSW